MGSMDGSTPMSAITLIVRTENSPASSPPGQSALGARAGEAPERVGQKIALHGQLANLGMQLLHPLLGVGGKTLTVGEQLRGALKQLLLPRRDLGGMDLVLLGELGERLIATDGLQSDLRLERWRVIATRPFHVDCSFHGQG